MTLDPYHPRTPDPARRPLRAAINARPAPRVRVRPDPVAAWRRGLLPLLLAIALALVLFPGRVRADSAPEGKVDPQAQAELEQARKDLRAAGEQMHEATERLVQAQRKAGIDTPFGRAFEGMGNPNRAVLGVSISSGPVQGDTLHGVLVTAVTPGSGADKAGVQTGDLILKANGQSLEVPASARGGSGRALRGVLAALEPGNTVTLLIERAGKVQSLPVVAGRLAPPFAMGAGAPPPDFDVDRLARHGDVLLPRPPMPPPMPGFGRGLQLARLDSDLSAYFKTGDGVLVVRAPPELHDGPLALRSGDVIQKIDGATVQGPIEVFEKIGDAAAGQRSLSLQLWRQGGSLTVQGVPAMPQRPDRPDRPEHHFFRNGPPA